MKTIHFQLVFRKTVALSIIGHGIEQALQQYIRHHSDKLQSNNQQQILSHLANWFILRNFQVNIYPFDNVIETSKLGILSELHKMRRENIIPKDVNIERPEEPLEAQLILRSSDYYANFKLFP